jgi:hypothetical protein
VSIVKAFQYVTDFMKLLVELCNMLERHDGNLPVNITGFFYFNVASSL